MNVQFKKNGVVQLVGLSDSSPIQDMKTKTLDDGSVWARIFYQNYKSETALFTSYAECMNTQTVDKYSRLYLLDEFKASDGKFEFMLCYPDDTTNYNRWKQTNNPCNEYYELSDIPLFVEGYEEIEISWTDNYWGGLARQNSESTNIFPCFLSGSIGHEDCFYAIGFSEVQQNGVPSYNDSYTQNCCELWVRIDTVPKQSQLKKYNNFITAKDFIEL